MRDKGFLWGVVLTLAFSLTFAASWSALADAETRALREKRSVGP